MGVNYLPFESAPSSVSRGIRWQRVALVFVFFWFFLGGIAHFVATEAEMRIVPPSVPDPRDVDLVSGFFELLGAAGLLLKWTRRAAGLQYIGRAGRHRLPHQISHSRTSCIGSRAHSSHIGTAGNWSCACSM